MLGYDFYYTGYKVGALTLDDIKYAVQAGDITADQYKTITGQDYTA